MEHYIEHPCPGHWSESRFGDSAARLPDVDSESRPSSSYLHRRRQQEIEPLETRKPCLCKDSTLMQSALLRPLVQETYGATREAGNWVSPAVLHRPHICKDMERLQLPYADVNSSNLVNLPSFPRSKVMDISNSSQAYPPQSSPTWCQSYINRPRSEGASVDTGSSGEGTHDEADGKRTTHSIQLRESRRDEHAGSCHLLQSDSQQLHQQIQGGHPLFVPLFRTHTGVAQPQGAAAVVAGTARPRIRARRGQATDPHSIAERLRRERIAERMKALQELVPNANKTDKASMLDEIIDYVKFLQLQVKVLSMSRLGGAGAVAPLITDFPGEGQTNLTAALSSTGFQDGMAAAERQVARLMEEDMGSAMQFLQGKGLCLMPISLASVISNNSKTMMGASGGNGRPVLHGMDQSRMHGASSTSTNLASVASSAWKETIETSDV